MKILAVGAHPDDEVLGCGGTLARLAKEGCRVHILILGEGITSRYPNREKAPQNLVESIRRQCREAARTIGAQEVRLHGLPDNRFDTVPILEVIKIIEAAIEEIRPEVIYTHHGGDLNVDHTIVHRAVLTAVRPFDGQQVQELYAFEVPSSTDWVFNQIHPIFRPNVFVNISTTLDLKIQALSLYESEIRSFPHPRSAEGISARARCWGSVAGFQAAEAFELIRALR